MDSLITAAAQALARGDPFGALNRVALREDPAALALRGIAMAQLGDLARARDLLRRAGSAFGPRQAVARARCVLAEAEIAFVSRDLGWPEAALDAARVVLERHGDRANAAHARCLELRRLLLLGRLDEVERVLAGDAPGLLPAAVRTAWELVAAGLALRRLRTADARAALGRAEAAARRAGIAALLAEVQAAARVLRTPVARLIAGGAARPVLLEEVEALQASPTLIVDACRHAARDRDTTVALARRPVLFALLRTLAEAWPGEASRALLVRRGFGGKEADESHRARLRVELGRLRALLRPLSAIEATRRGFALAPHRGRSVVVLAQPVETGHAEVLALLADGEAWASSAVALALGTSQRSVQRGLDALAAEGRVESFGRGRARRWLTTLVPGFPTALLLPALLSGD